MTHADVVKYEYNFWVQRFQFDMCSLRENSTPAPQNIRLLVSKKHQEEVASELHRIAHFAYAGGEGELASKIDRAALELTDDGVPPMPM